MNPKILLYVAFAAANLSVLARPVRVWSEAELMAASDLVVIGRPVNVKDLEETNSLGWPSTESFQSRFRGVETTFEFSGVSKGMPTSNQLANGQIVLHHYRAEPAWGSPPDGPALMSFTPGGTNEYLLYLKNDGTKRYAPTAGQIDPGLSIKGHDPYTDAKAHFRDYLNHCDTNDINSVWFEHNRPDVGMVMTIHLDPESVFTVRSVYDWAEQNEETRRLTHTQVLSLQQIITNLPASNTNADFSKSVFVSIRNGEKVEVFQYDRQDAPAIIQRNFDIGGGYFETNVVAP